MTQCRCLLPTNKLFVKGFVRKNIQYASPSKDIADSTTKSISSDIHSLTVDIPFQCVTEIKHFLTCPVMPKTNDRNEFDFFTQKHCRLDFRKRMNCFLTTFLNSIKKVPNFITSCHSVN